MRILLASTYYGAPTSADILYGGMERVNWFLARELVQLGHDVTLMGAVGTKLEGATVVNYYISEMDSAIAYVRENRNNWDVLHDSSHDLPLSTAMRDSMPCLSTMHNPNNPKGAPNAVAISDFHKRETMNQCQRKSMVVYNGVPEDYYPFYPNKERYVGLMGALEARKGLIPSIKAAKEAGVPIKLAGLKSVDAELRKEMDSLVDGESVIFCGVLGGKEKQDFMGYARAMMLCVYWPEPGSMIGPESMAMGTPLIVNFTGCPQEYVVQGETGFAVDESQMAEAIHKAANIDPVKVHERWRTIFNSRRMALEYMALYERVLAGETW